jgi:hypothetical protein
MVVADEHVRPNAGALAFMSGHSRKGDWNVPRRFRAVAVMGSVELDLREARIPEGESEIEVFAFWGSIAIIIPPGVGVECEGDGFMGEFSFNGHYPEALPPDAPVIRLKGGAYMSSVEATVRYAGESEGDAKRRMKAAKR